MLVSSVVECRIHTPVLMGSKTSGVNFHAAANIVQKISRRIPNFSIFQNSITIHHCIALL
jgi:hypothetical protein